MTPGTSDDVVLHRLEALLGDGRYAVTFRRPDGGEQSAVVQLTDAGVTIAESALPVGWTLDSDTARATLDAVSALDHARRIGARSGVATLRDVEGGWDVGLGNVVLGADGTPRCTAHGELVAQGDVWVCPECDARAVYA